MPSFHLITRIDLIALNFNVFEMRQTTIRNLNPQTLQVSIHDPKISFSPDTTIQLHVAVE